MNGTLRSLARAPSFTGTAVAALAVGLGASTALFSVLDGVLFRPLPFPAPDQLMTVYARTATGDLAALSYAEFVDWRAQMPPSVQRMAFSYGNGARFRTKHGASSALIDLCSAP